jgi:cobalt-precorrin 5A hydrolase / precorrin-3B C17-methyltransferase
MGGWVIGNNLSVLVLPFSPYCMPLAIVILNQHSLLTARRIAAGIPDSKIYGLNDRLSSHDVDVSYPNFGELIRELFRQRETIIGICAAGILIRTIAPLLDRKWEEPPILAVAEDGSAVVPLLGGVRGVNHLARQIGDILTVNPAITTSGDLRFGTALLSPPPGYTLANPDDAKTFLANLLSGAKVKIVGDAPWLVNANLPLDDRAELTITITAPPGVPSPTQLVYYPPAPTTGSLAIVGTGPGSGAWMSPEVKEVLTQATDWVGYTTYLNLVEPLRTHQQRHASDNREELERAKFALNLAAKGKAVVVVSSGDPGIYAMAAAVFEAIDRHPQPEWLSLPIQVCPGISAMQAAAARAGAPLGHDFCVISLSDLLKPWSAIVDRLSAAAMADFVIAIYNPKSTQRLEQLDAAKAILLKYRSSDTPIVLARNLGRKGEAIEIKSLGELASADVDMRTILIIGSSQTKTIDRWVYTPRYYSK